MFIHTILYIQHVELKIRYIFRMIYSDIYKSMSVLLIRIWERVGEGGDGDSRFYIPSLFLQIPPPQASSHPVPASGWLPAGRMKPAVSREQWRLKMVVANLLVVVVGVSSLLDLDGGMVIFLSTLSVAHISISSLLDPAGGGGGGGSIRLIISNMKRKTINRKGKYALKNGRNCSA
jgi:hypothetical protein